MTLDIQKRTKVWLIFYCFSKTVVLSKNSLCSCCSSALWSVSFLVWVFIFGGSDRGTSRRLSIWFVGAACDRCKAFRARSSWSFSCSFTFSSRSRARRSFSSFFSYLVSSSIGSSSCMSSSVPSMFSIEVNIWSDSIFASFSPTWALYTDSILARYRFKRRSWSIWSKSPSLKKYSLVPQGFSKQNYLKSRHLSSKSFDFCNSFARFCSISLLWPIVKSRSFSRRLIVVFA